MRLAVQLMFSGLLFGALLVGCAAPPLTLYTLGTAPDAAERRPLTGVPVVILVARVGIQDDLDTEDIVLRDGSTLRRSHQGRWASRLSLGVTNRLTQRLAARYPWALVTDRPLSDTPTDRVLINIERLDVTTAGAATLDADWLVIPRDTASATIRNRANFNISGPVGTDQDVVALIGALLDKLASVIDIPKPR